MAAKKLTIVGWDKDSVHLSRPIFCLGTRQVRGVADEAEGQTNRRSYTPIGFVRLNSVDGIQVSQAVCDTDHSGRSAEGS